MTAEIKRTLYLLRVKIKREGDIEDRYKRKYNFAEDDVLWLVSGRRLDRC